MIGHIVTNLIRCFLMGAVIAGCTALLCHMPAAIADGGMSVVLGCVIFLDGSCLVGVLLYEWVFLYSSWI